MSSRRALGGLAFVHRCRSSGKGRREPARFVAKIRATRIAQRLRRRRRRSIQ
jgi:hypothetical protein